MRALLEHRIEPGRCDDRRAVHDLVVGREEALQSLGRRRLGTVVHLLRPARGRDDRGELAAELRRPEAPGDEVAGRPAPRPRSRALRDEAGIGTIRPPGPPQPRRAASAAASSAAPPPGRSPGRTGRPVEPPSGCARSRPGGHPGSAAGTGQGSVHPQRGHGCWPRPHDASRARRHWCRGSGRPGIRGARGLRMRRPLDPASGADSAASPADRYRAGQSRGRDSPFPGIGSAPRRRRPRRRQR